MPTLTKPVGRYAPSPTGDLHLGNLRTALLAWLYIRLQRGTYLVRMEDLDTPRVVPGSAAKILRDMEWLGLDWDDEVRTQSESLEVYEAALNMLEQQGALYPCFCSRKDIQLAASAPHGKMGVYPGTCEALDSKARVEKRLSKKPAIRVRTNGRLADDCGDFVVKRADNLFAYQLAVVVDDLSQGVTQVVRGEDLADSTLRQHFLAQLLAPNTPPINYHHVPLMLDQAGLKMSKRDGSKSVDEWCAQGRTAAEMVGHLAFSLGLIPQLKALTTQELLASVSLPDLTNLFIDG